MECQAREKECELEKRAEDIKDGLGWSVDAPGQSKRTGGKLVVKTHDVLAGNSSEERLLSI